MLREEFERLTGFYPSADLYRVIEVRYSEFDGDKAAFCKAYKSNKDGLAESIQRDRDLAEGNAVEAAVSHVRRQKDAEIRRLSQALAEERAKAAVSHVRRPEQEDTVPMMETVISETHARLLALRATLSIIQDTINEDRTADAISGLLFMLDDMADDLETVIPGVPGSTSRDRAEVRAG